MALAGLFIAPTLIFILSKVNSKTESDQKPPGRRDQGKKRTKVLNQSVAFSHFRQGNDMGSCGGRRAAKRNVGD